MSELFLEQSAEVLDDWEAVRDDAAWSDAMRWSPEREPRRIFDLQYGPPVPDLMPLPLMPHLEAVSGVWIASADINEGDPVYVGRDWTIEPVPRGTFLTDAIRRLMPTVEVIAREMAETMSAVSRAFGVSLDVLRDQWDLTDGRIVTAEELARGAKVLPLPIDGREYRRRRKARARRRR